MGDKRLAAAAAVAVDDMGEGMQCMDHPYQANPGGICAFCLQEKLGKLVSSSMLSGPFFPLQPPLSPSSSSPPASAAGVALASFDAAAAASIIQKKKKSGIGGAGISGRKVSAAGGGATATATFATGARNDLVLKRSKSVAPRPIGGSMVPEGVGSSRLAGADLLPAESPRKKSFWSFLYLSSPSSSSASLASNANNSIYSNRRRSTSSSGVGAGRDLPKQQQQEQLQVQIRDDALMARKDNGNELEEAGSPSSGSQASSSFGRKVARSRSVGCGSRSFSGDFLERISTGLGDCALRRVESHREAKAKIVLRLDHDGEDEEDEQQLQRRMNERVKCGLFGGFGMMSSSLWLSAGLDDDLDNCNRISAATPVAAAAAAAAVVRGVSTTAPNGRTRSWGWTFASPMRAFRPASTSKHPYAIKNNADASTGATAAAIIAPIMSSSSSSSTMGIGGGNTSNNKSMV